MTTNKLKLALLAAGALSVGAAPLTSFATPITGAISFDGNVTAYEGPPTAPGSTIAPDFTQAQSLVFGYTQVAAGANGSFAGLDGSSVTVHGPLGVNPAIINTGGPIWSVGGFSFNLTVLTEPTDLANVLVLSGTGTITDVNSADTTSGTWVATFTEAGTYPGVTFSWNSSSAAVASPVVPETGASLVFLGLGLAGLGAFAKFRKQSAVATV